jgi:hypothetical protein
VRSVPDIALRIVEGGEGNRGEGGHPSIPSVFITSSREVGDKPTPRDYKAEDGHPAPCAGVFAISWPWL